MRLKEKMNKNIKQLYKLIAKLEKELGYTTDIHNLTVIANDLERESIIPFSDWLADRVSDSEEFIGEAGLMEAYEDEELQREYDDYVIEKAREL